MKKFDLKKEGFNCIDPIYVLLPKCDAYIPMNKNLLTEINAGTYIF